MTTAVKSRPATKKFEPTREQKILEGVLNYHFARNPMDVTLGEPAQLTVRRSDGSYRKRAFIGGEDFTTSSVYVGKTGKMIAVFKPKLRFPGPSADYAFVESEFEEAKRLFEGFQNAIEVALQFADDSLVKDVREQMLKDRYGESYDDPRFGSW